MLQVIPKYELEKKNKKQKNCQKEPIITEHAIGKQFNSHYSSKEKPKMEYLAIKNNHVY